MVTLLILFGLLAIALALSIDYALRIQQLQIQPEVGQKWARKKDKTQHLLYIVKADEGNYYVTHTDPNLCVASRLATIALLEWNRYVYYDKWYYAGRWDGKPNQTHYRTIVGMEW